MQEVAVTRKKVTIPTYQIAEYDKNPMFLEKRVYQGSSGRVYPHPVCEGVSDTKVDQEYDAIYLENEYLQVMILPELGGRIQRLYDKTNGYDAVYYNHVIKPALVGLAGPWISGGIEFNWPQHHRPSTFDKQDARIVENADGSVTVWVGETEKMFHTKGAAGFTLYPDKAYLEIKGQVYNPTDRPQTFLWWANPAVAVNEYTQSIFPPDVHAVYDHGKRDVSEFPIAKGVYYKVDYAPGTDISRYRNIPVPTSYMAEHSDYDFIGNYDHEKRAGLLHVADHHVSPGKKQWTWGNGDFGKAWDRNLTDEDGPYIELMTGMFTDNQPDFTFLKPYEEKTFTQYFMPYKEIGAVKNANTRVAINMEKEESKARIQVYAMGEEKVTLCLKTNEVVFWQEKVTLNPTDTYQKVVDLGLISFEDCALVVRTEDGQALMYRMETEQKYEVPSPAEALPKPELLDSNEKLFLAAVHLEQYRHATYDPKDYYLEALRRDPEDMRCNNGYGKLLYRKGFFVESETHFRRAVKRSIWKNPNPYDCEPYYNLGLSLQAQGKWTEAYDAFYKATWDGNMQDKAFYQLGCISTRRGDYQEAIRFTECSLDCGRRSRRARGLYAALLRKLHQEDEYEWFLQESERIDPLDYSVLAEKWFQKTIQKNEMVACIGADNHNYLELALAYREYGLFEEAEKLLLLAPNEKDPMKWYYLFEVTGCDEYLKQAEKADRTYCFPNRLEDISVLEHAREAGGSMAAYYLGNLYYDAGRRKEAIFLWEQCISKLQFPTVYRNLSLGYANEEKKHEKAKVALEQAFSMDETDARVFFEWDQLSKLMNVPVPERLSRMEKHRDLLEKRDDLYTEYIGLLNRMGRYEEAYSNMMHHHFHPWEGGEGKITSQYRIALRMLSRKAKAESDLEHAIALLEEALQYPVNLGEGKLIGNLDNDLYYELGLLYDAFDPLLAKEYYRLAARGENELGSAMYYNDQPVEMRYYAGMALEKLGQHDAAYALFSSFLQYGETHQEDQVEIDYFAVSLPDFLVFDGDLSQRNKVHCIKMKALGFAGMGDAEKASNELAKARKEQADFEWYL